MSVGPDVNPGVENPQRKPNPGGMVCFKNQRNKHVIPPGLFWVIGTLTTGIDMPGYRYINPNGFFTRPDPVCFKDTPGLSTSFNPVGFG